MAANERAEATVKQSQPGFAEVVVIRATFRIQLPDSVWVAGVSRQFPDATFHLLSGYRTDDSAVELGETITETPDAVVETMRAHPSIREYELLEVTGDRVLGKYETTDTELYEFVEMSGQTIEFPVTVRRGWYEFDLTGTREELDGLRAVLDGSPLSYELESIVTATGTDALLTDRQRELLEAAVREGYFEVPRECTLADLAETVGVDKSSASTVLRRGQARIVKWFLAGPKT